MSRLRFADYSEHLRGKTIDRCEWYNEIDENRHCLQFFFSDSTTVIFRLSLIIMETAELDQRELVPLPITRK